MWFATMSVVCSNHHADSWFSTCPLYGTVGDDPIERRQPVGRDEDPSPVRQRVGDADLAVTPIVEGEIEVEQWFGQWVASSWHRHTPCA